jgi:hypothetical protein
MAGAYGEINSRTDFDRILHEAADIVRRLPAAQRNSTVMQQVGKELEAMRRWSDKGRVPSASERKGIDVGLIAVRELSESTGAAHELAQKLFVLNNYFEDWPSDEEAACDEEDDE